MDEAALFNAASALYDDAHSRNAITREAALDCEKALAPFSAGAKKLTVHMLGHAHIDMNWRWRYDETVNITIETFRTVLGLMDDFPDFTFSQSQASCYRIVEKYEPALLARIAEKVASGRWEVTASTWTECDKNMPSGESLARHILYTKRYMNKLFSLSEDALRIDYEPDTFGHSANLPEILSAGGVEFYYHCRGDAESQISNWRSPSGATVLVYRDPWFYNENINPGRMVSIPSFCINNGVSDAMIVYGVGDHGGGPTRRDLERIVDMSGWPLFPTIKFGMYHDYYETIKPLRETFPVIERELNFIFTGCYTAQSRIKAANRHSEAALYEAEALASLLPPAPAADPALFEDSWRDVLFSQFHDILPGAGVPDTREHARGLFQEVLARANTQKSIACYAIADMVDTSSLEGGLNLIETRSEGAGVGYGLERSYNLAPVERGKGTRRGYLLFNTVAGRTGVATFSMWDWLGDLKTLRVTDSAGQRLPFQILEGNADFQGHERTEVAVYCEMPSLGWKLIIADEDANAPLTFDVPHEKGDGLRVHKPYAYTLENEILRAELDPASGAIRTLADKRTGKTAAATGGFFGLTESANVTNSAWMIGRYMNDSQPITVEKIEWLNRGGLRNSVKVTGRYKNSKISYIISLDKGAEHLAYEAEIDWLEVGSLETGMPMLHFKVGQASPSEEYFYDIPMGWANRPAMDMDLPGLSYSCSCPESGQALAIISRDKYGYRNTGGHKSLTLILTSYRPDPYPEQGRHIFTFYIAVPAEATPAYMGCLSSRLCHPVFAQSVKPHNGALPAERSLLRCDAAISCVKPAEDGSGDIIVRLYDDTGKDREVTLTLAYKTGSASLCTLTETPVKKIPVLGGSIAIPLKKYSIATVRVETKR